MDAAACCRGKLSKSGGPSAARTTRIVQRCLVVVPRGPIALSSGASVVSHEGQDLLFHLREGLQ